MESLAGSGTFLSLDFDVDTFDGAHAYRFLTKEADFNPGLVYIYRFYNSNLQRWPNRDPIAEIGFSVARGEEPTVEVGEETKLYTFVLNDSLSKTDSLGLALSTEDCERIRITCMGNTAKDVAGGATISLGQTACKTGIAAAVGHLWDKTKLKWITGAGTLYSMYDLGRRIGEGFDNSKICANRYARCIEAVTDPKKK